MAEATATGRRRLGSILGRGLWFIVSLVTGLVLLRPGSDESRRNAELWGQFMLLQVAATLALGVLVTLPLGLWAWSYGFGYAWQSIAEIPRLWASYLVWVGAAGVLFYGWEAWLLALPSLARVPRTSVPGRRLVLECTFWLFGWTWWLIGVSLAGVTGHLAPYYCVRALERSLLVVVALGAVLVPWGMLRCDRLLWPRLRFGRRLLVALGHFLVLGALIGVAYGIVLWGEW